MSKSLKKIIIIAVILIASTGYNYFQNNFQNPSSESARPAIDNKALTLSKIRRAAETQKSGWWLSTEGKVVKILKDDTKGSRHQKFLLKLAPDITLLVAHNIDIAPRAPLQQGDSIMIRGRYEWNHRGGVLHWTHRDSKGKKKGGWIYHRNQYYK